MTIRTAAEQAVFLWTDAPEPHGARRKAIMAAHPEVRSLVGTDPRLALIALALVVLQVASAVLSRDLVHRPNGPLYFVLVAYALGATVAQSLFMAIHEITHNLAFRGERRNNWLALVANIPIVLPFAMAFKAYHALHHRYQGVDGVDVDVPTVAESRIFSGRVGKTLWAFGQILFYAFRPLFVRPLRLDGWHLVNAAMQLATMGALVAATGWVPVLYLLTSVFLAGSLHPMAGHFVAEHFVTEPGQETYSYYGPLNRLVFNVGYHNEHHDFPSIPGSRLPLLKRMAPEFYEPLRAHTSWTRVLVSFILNPDIGLHSRVKRSASSSGERHRGTPGDDE